MDFGKGKEGKKAVRRCGKLWNLERKKKNSKWTGLFSVNGLGLEFEEFLKNFFVISVGQGEKKAERI